MAKRKISKFRFEPYQQLLWKLKLDHVYRQKKDIKIPVQGGLDPKILLTDKETIKKEIIKYLDIFKNHPYIFNLGHGVLPETDPNMFEYMVNTVKNY